MKKFYAFLLWLFTWPASGVFAQLDNAALEKPLPVKAAYNQDIRVGLDVFGFLKNNEYFNDIADGYTLFGYQLNPKLVYFPASFIRLEAGAWLWQDFGTTRYNQVRPTFTLKIQKPHYQLLFGNLQANVSHRYIEPLYDVEKVINDPLENGMQFIWNRNKLWLDAWINWQKMIYRGDPFREEIAGGLSAEQHLVQDEVRGWQLSLPVQFTAQHKGGQIDASPLPLVTLFNGAVGFKLRKNIDGKFWKAWHTQNYLVGFKDFSNVYQYPFTSGTGLYLNAGLDTRVQNVMLSYWRGNGYLAEQGGRLFQSASTTFKKPNYLEERRELLILRFSHDIKLLDDMFLTLRLEPLYDFKDPQLEFSSSFYLRYTTDFFVTKRKE